jgi:hypothetical protein
MELGKVPVSTRWIGVFAELYGVPEHEVLGYHHPPEDEMDDERVELLALIQKLPQREVRTLVTLARELARQRDEGAGEQ